MKNTTPIPFLVWRLISRFNRQMLLHYGPKSKAAGRILVLTTTGRESGLKRSTPLQYEEVDGVYYVASARGVQADWYRNLLACPTVQVKVGEKDFTTLARPMTDAEEVANFLELRLRRHPHFMKIMLRLEGLPGKYTRVDLEKLAERLAVVRLHPA